MPLPTPTPTDEPALRPSPPRDLLETGDENAVSVTEDPIKMADEAVAPLDSDAPISFVPHLPLNDTVKPRPLRIRTGRFGELEEHELVRLLDSIEDERARSRFRESIYLSIFVWLAIAGFVFFGPKYLWHAPRVVLPSEVLRAREMTTLTAPSNLRHSVPQAMDARTLEHLRSNATKAAPSTPKAATPAPPAPAPPAAVKPAPPARTQPRSSLPSAPTPNLRPSNNLPNLPAAPAPQPTPRTTPPAVADAPRPQPSSRPNFNSGSQSAGDSIQQAVKNATRGGGTASGGSSISNGGRGGSDLGAGYEVLSDTQGVDFGPYITRILREIYGQWIQRIPEEARPPLRKSGTTMLRITIQPDGTLGNLQMDGSTHDDALNKAAWGSVTGVGQFPPLPPQFHGPNLELRIHYLVNRQTE